MVEQEASGSAARRVTGADDRLHSAGRSHAPCLRQLADPAIRIVSLTVTEGGYFIDPATGKFDPDHPAIARRRRQPADRPKTVFGLILAGLGPPRSRASHPFTVMSCDNIPHNGVVDAQRRRRACASCRIRISPTGSRPMSPFPMPWSTASRPPPRDRERDICANDFGIDDAWPVFCEELQAMGAGGQFPRRPAGAGEGRRAVRRRT